jgi:histidinol-phosphatase
VPDDDTDPDWQRSGPGSVSDLRSRRPAAEEAGEEAGGASEDTEREPSDD